MGKGDKKTRRGKLFQGSFGVRRPKKTSRKTSPLPLPKITANAGKEVKPTRDMKEKEPVAAIPENEVPEVVETKAVKETAKPKTAKSPAAKKETKTKKSAPPTEHETEEKV